MAFGLNRVELIGREDRHFKAPIHARGEVSNGLARMV